MCNDVVKKKLKNLVEEIYVYVTRLLKRKTFPHNNISILLDLKFEKEYWLNYLRMDIETYLLLLKRVSPIIKKIYHNEKSCNQ